MSSVSQRKESLEPLLRLRQIVEELRAAAKRNDLEVVRAAAKLLAPTVEQCKQLRDADYVGAGEAAELALNIRHLLSECEQILTESMRGVSCEMRRIRQGKRAIAMARGRRVALGKLGGLNG
jgi:hypothetical protein